MIPGGVKVGKLFLRRGQNLTELALVIGVVGLVLVGMEIYFKRGFQGKVKDLTDALISPNQEAYQQDTSGLVINASSSTTIVDPVRNVSTENRSVVGGLTTNAQEYTTTTYVSTASDY
jgi:hypothetical protein